MFRIEKDWKEKPEGPYSITSSIRQANRDDVDFVHKMLTEEEWNDTRQDVERMLSFEPEGCFIAEKSGEPIGHVFTVTYGKLGWIGYLIVDSRHRNRGVGTLLMEKAMNYLSGRGVETVKLESVPEISNLYRRLGFVDEYDSLRFAAVNTRKTAQQNGNVGVHVAEDLDRITDFDREFFGADRTNVLSRLFKEFPELTFVSLENRDIAGYVMCRAMQEGVRIGPFVCDPEKQTAAVTLLSKCMEKIDQRCRVFVGVPEINQTALELLKKFGFSQYSKSIRMWCGKRISNDNPLGIFAIAGPMKG